MTGRGNRRFGTGAVLACFACAATLLILPASAASAGVHAGTSPRTVVILLDANWSMAAALPAEREAALGYARALPSDVRAGLITFGVHWVWGLRPTVDRNSLATALAASRPTGETSTGIYGALSAATSALDRSPAAARSRLVVISDAEDVNGSVPTTTVPTDAVLWRIDGDDGLGILRAVADATGGHAVRPADAASLAAAFPPLARVAPGPAAQPGAAKSQNRWPGRLTALLATVFAALLALALLVIASLRQHGLSRNLANQIERYAPNHRAAAAGEGKVASMAIGWMTRVLRSSSSEPRLAQRLDLAGITRKPAEWALLCVCLGTALAVALTVLTGNPLVGVLGGVLIGWLGMRLAVSMRIGRRRAAFSEQLPDLLRLIAGSLESGFSLPQALDAVVREDSQPAAGEFSRALAEARIGVDVDVALEGVAIRMDSIDLRWAVMAIRIQREVGGNLAEVLRTTVGTMRERAFLRRQVRALSAEGRLSAYVLTALPLVVGAWMFFVNPRYMRPLYTTAIGLFMIVITSLLFTLGVFWMRNVIKVEV